MVFKNSVFWNFSLNIQIAARNQSKYRGGELKWTGYNGCYEAPPWGGIYYVYRGPND